MSVLKGKFERLSEVSQRRLQDSLEMQIRIRMIIEECRKETGGRPTARAIAKQVGLSHVSVAKYLRKMELSDIPITIGAQNPEKLSSPRRPIGVTARMIKELVDTSIANTGRRPANRDIARELDIGERVAIDHLKRLGLLEMPALPPKREPNPKSKQKMA